MISKEFPGKSEGRVCMISNNFFDILETKIPGGCYPDLDKNIVPERNLYLTRLSTDGLEDMHEYSKDERLYKYFEFRPFQNVNETKDYLQKLINRTDVKKNNGKYMYWFIRLIGNRKIIGTIGLVDIDRSRESASWGYAISPDYWGVGYILEAQLLVVQYFFEVLEMNRLYGITAIDNEAVLSSIASAGFKQEGILREYYKFLDGRRGDAIVYGLLAKEYFDMKKQEVSSSGRGSLAFEKVKDIFISVFGVPESGIQKTTKMSDIPQWDSLSHIILMVKIEEALGIKLNPLEMAKATNVGAILDIVNEV